MATNRASKKVPGKSAQKHATDDDVEDLDDSDESEGQAADGSDNSPDAATEIISIELQLQLAKKPLTITTTKPITLKYTGLQWVCVFITVYITFLTFY